MARYEESSFPIKLMEILNEDCYKDIMEWLPDGSGFIILNKQRCQKEVLPLYFKLTKYSSFTRRLNRWNFMFRNNGHSRALYFHPFFTMTDPQLCLKMRPKPQKNYSRAGKKRVTTSKSYSKKCKRTRTSTIATTGAIANATQRQRDLKSLPQDLLQQNSYILEIKNSYAHSNGPQISSGRHYSTMLVANKSCSRDPHLVGTPAFPTMNPPVVYHVGSQGGAAILQNGTAINQYVHSCLRYVPPPSCFLNGNRSSTFLGRDCNFVQEATRDGSSLHHHHHYFSQVASEKKVHGSCHYGLSGIFPTRHESLYPSNSSANVLLAEERQPPFVLGRPNLSDNSGTPPPLLSYCGNRGFASHQSNGV